MMMLTMVGGSDEGGWSESTLAWSCRWCPSRVVRNHLLPCGKRSLWVAGEDAGMLGYRTGVKGAGDQVDTGP